MLLNLDKEIDRSRFESRSKALLDKRCIVDLTEKTKRSQRQNRYLHLVIAWWGMETGHNARESKRVFKYLNKDVFFYKKRGIEQIKSSADIEKDVLTKCIEKFRKWSNEEFSVYLPTPDEQAFLQEIEIKKSQNQFY